MADPNTCLPYNLPGRFYVDNTCIDCDLCREAAPHNFRRYESENMSYVYKQPENPDELEQCIEAFDGCPVGAIGDRHQELPA
jgi:ferredoxin